jgi:hypothetical protein
MILPEGGAVDHGGEPRRGIDERQSAIDQGRIPVVISIRSARSAPPVSPWSIRSPEAA